MKKTEDGAGVGIKPVLNWSAAASIIIALIATFSYLSSSFVSVADIEKERELRVNQDLVMQRQLNQLASYIVSSHDSLSQEIRDSKGFALSVQRDILQSRTDLTPNEKAELTVILTKISELNRDRMTRMRSMDPVPIFRAPGQFKMTNQ